ncbi:MAG: hypothetical protein ABW090_08235 [Sedimenticola sp.]
MSHSRIIFFMLSVAVYVIAYFYLYDSGKEIIILPIILGILIAIPGIIEGLLWRCIVGLTPIFVIPLVSNFLGIDVNGILWIVILHMLLIGGFGFQVGEAIRALIIK